MTIADMKVRVRVEDVVGAKVSLRRKGQLFIGRCPFHDDRGRPNLVVFPKTQTWCCFACGAQGDVVDFVARTEGVTLRQALAILAGQARRSDRPVPQPPACKPARASPAACDTAYRALLESRPLLARHKDLLTGRGFRPETVERNGYRSHAPGPVPGGVDVKNVPGFYRGETGWAIAGPKGLLIPVRDADGRIVACQVRADDPRRGKYMWISSARMREGASPGAPCHVAAGSGRRVWITEGPLKADLAGQELGETVIGVAGVATWRSALAAVARLRPEEAVVAFDQDADPATREAVDRNATSLAQALSARGIRVLVAEWEGAKGLDDALVAGVDLRIVRHAR